MNIEESKNTEDMGKFPYDNEYGKDVYVSPSMTVAQAEICEVFCTSNPGSDYIEDMKPGADFDNWI